MALRGRRVLIPKGTLSPGKNNVIEIPESASTSKIIVATKPKGGDSDCDKDCPAAGDTNSPRQESRQRPPTQVGSRSKEIRRSRALDISASHSVTTVGPDMAELERREQKNFREDLKEFQDARKKLFADVITLQMARKCKNKKKL